MKREPTTTLRIPKEVKRKIKAMAKIKKVSPHAYAIKVLSDHVN